MNRLQVIFQPRNLLSSPVFISTFIFSLAMHLIDTAHNVKGHQVQRTAIILLVNFALFGTVWLLNKVVLQNLRAKYSAALLIPTIFLGAAVRGLLLQGLLVLSHINAGVSLKFRMQASITNVSLVVIVSTITYSWISTYSQENSRLIAEQRRLHELRSLTLQQMSLFDLQFKESIVHELNFALKDFETLRAFEALELLRNAIDEVVRPLSEYLDRNTSKFDFSEIQISEYRINWLKVFVGGAKLENLTYLPVVLSLIVFGGPALTNDLAHPTALLEVMSVLILGPVIFKICILAFRILLKRINRFFEPLLAFFALLIPGALLGLESTLVLNSTIESQQFLFLIPAFSLLLGFLFSVLKSAKNEVVGVREQLNDAAGQLRWEVARAREVHRQQQRILNFTLHGEIQAAFESSFLKLQLALESEGDSLEFRSELLELMKSAIENIYRDFKDPEPIVRVLERVSVTWEGISKVKAVLDSNLSEKISSDSICNIALSDLVTELVFNAVKHGKSSNIEITFSFEDEATVSLAVINDGLAPKTVTRAGLGSKLLEESTLSWNRRVEDKKTITTALIPFLVGLKSGGDEEI